MIERIGIWLTARRRIGQAMVIQGDEGGSFLGTVVSVGFNWIRMRDHDGDEFYLKVANVKAMAFGPTMDRKFEQRCEKAAKRAANGDGDEDADRTEGQLPPDFIQQFMAGRG